MWYRIRQKTTQNGRWVAPAGSRMRGTIPIKIGLLFLGIVVGGLVSGLVMRALWVEDINSLHLTHKVDLLRWELVLLRSYENNAGGQISMENRVKLSACEHYDYATMIVATDTDWSTHFSSKLKQYIVLANARDRTERSLGFIQKHQLDLLSGCQELLKHPAHQRR